MQKNEDMRPNEGEHDDDEIKVTDRRRFGADGTKVDQVEEAEEQETAQAEPTPEPPSEPEVVPAWEAREWERRALDAEEKIREVKDAYRRHKHELNMTRERLERDQQARVDEALGRSFSRILEAMDMLDMALAHAEDGPLAEGVRLVQRKMLESLEGEGLERFETMGQPYDPEIAEAIAMIPVDDAAKKGVVVAEQRAGYRFKGRVLRPAQVHVGAGS